MYLRSIIMVITTVAVNVFSGNLIAEGNRYNIERYYQAEISAAQANRNLTDKRWLKRKYSTVEKPLLIDVRTLEEYAAGHPLESFNVPYPRVCANCEPQSEENFYWEVYNLVKGNTDRMIMTLCRTGKRSVTGGNVLAKPSEFGIDGPAFTNVYNIWEGFVGQYKYAYDGGTIMLDTNHEPIALDLNNNGMMDSDSADVYLERNDANQDKDGWRNFQNLPWTTRILYHQSYKQDPWQYKELSLTPVN